MITFDNLGVPVAVLAQVSSGPGGTGIPGPPGPGKTCARTTTGTPKISKVIIFLDPYREFWTSPKRLWTPKKRRPEQLFWPAEPKMDLKWPQPPWRGGGGCPASPCELGTPLPSLKGGCGHLRSSLGSAGQNSCSGRRFWGVQRRFGDVRNSL